jgi:SAM-dependent methyltransferase
MAPNVQGLWASGDAYENYMGRWSRLIAPRFLEWLGAAPKEEWLDIGCGAGVLSAAILAQCDPARVAGIDASKPFVEAARAQVRDPRFEVRTGNALTLPFDDREFGFAVSGLVLNFTGDSGSAAAEMVRVVRPGGRVALYVWDYAGHMQIMRHFFDAATAMDARAREFDDGVRAPICRPGPLGELFDAAGLRDVDVRAIDIPAAFEGFDDYWNPFLGGTGSAPKYYASLPPEQQIALRDSVRRRLPVGPGGEILLAVRAWAVQGTVT